MSLYVIATPIGNPDDLGRRAQKLLMEAEVIIGEEAKPTRAFLKSAGVPPQKRIELLNEHTRIEEVQSLANLCRQQTVALISDCGTPGFCDPGAQLVRLCRQQKIEVRSVPGPSSLMALLSIAGHRLDRFHFEGFLPANTEERQLRLSQISSLPHPIILMDTPYRLHKTLEDCLKYFPKRHLILGLNLSRETELVVEGTPDQVLKATPPEKAEFVLIIK